MHVLIVGAGSVGQVYGHHLVQGGATITFLVRAHHPTGLRHFALRQLPGDRGHSLEAMVISDINEAPDCDVVLLTVPSDALDPAWLEPLGQQLPVALFVSLQPGLDDTQVVERAVGKRCASGMIGFIAFPSPLQSPNPTETTYWFPPLVKSQLSQSVDLKPFWSCLSAGKMPIAVQNDTQMASAFGSAVLLPHMAALELNGWSLTQLRGSSWLGVAHQASREVALMVAARHDTGIPLQSRLLRRWLTRPLLMMLPRLAPFPLEPYLKVHFSKVGSQTVKILADYQAEGERLGIPTPSIQELSTALARQ